MKKLFKLVRWAFVKNIFATKIFNQLQYNQNNHFENRNKKMALLSATFIFLII